MTFTSTSLIQLVRSAFERLVFVLRWLCAPTRCAACDAEVPFDATFCAEHAASIKRAPKGLTLPCLAASIQGKRQHPPEGPPPNEAQPQALQTIAFALYSHALADAICRFKYGDRPDLSHPLGQLLRTAVREQKLTVDLIIPVPLHSDKLRRRGYNQAALLASAVASATGAPVAARALVRTRATEPQASLGRTGRIANVKGAIRVRDCAVIQGKTVALVDDVATTGSTLAACAHALLDAGAHKVVSVVLAVREAR